MSEVTARATQQAVEELTSYLIKSGAENYIEDHYTIRIDGGSETTAVITVQYTDKPSAHELRVRAEQECERLRAECIRLDNKYERDVWGLNNEGDPIGGEPAGGFANDLLRVATERDAALKLLAKCQEKLDPHRDAVLWGEVCDAFKVNS